MLMSAYPEKLLLLNSNYALVDLLDLHRQKRRLTIEELEGSGEFKLLTIYTL